MTETENEQKKMELIKELIGEGKIDDVVEKIALYLNQSTEENYIDRLENIIETISPLHGGRTVIRFLIEHNIIDVPGLIENLSKKDPLLRYSFLNTVLKDICENEGDLFLPYSEDLMNSDDPNVREANLQLLIFMAAGEKIDVDQQSLIETIASKLNDEKDFVAEKAIQFLKMIGKKSPAIITRILTEYAKSCPERENLKKRIDTILKSIVTIERIEEIVEEEVKEAETDEKIFKEESELKKKKIELKKEKLEIEEKVQEFEEKAIVKKEKALKIKKELLEEKEIKLIEKAQEKITTEDLEKSKEEILDKKLELKKKDLEIKKKKLELEEKEKELEKKAILEKEKALKLKEKLIEKEKQITHVELELKEKEIKRKEIEIIDHEAKKIKERLEEEKQEE